MKLINLYRGACLSVVVGDDLLGRKLIKTQLLTEIFERPAF